MNYLCAVKRIIHTIYALFLCILVNAQTLFTNPEVFPKREDLPAL